VQVTRLALMLFDELCDLHGLGAEDRYILCLAGLLHDVGVTVSYAGHHKHSRTIIARTELPGVTKRQRRLAAQVARYHRKKAPSTTHARYAKLPAEDRRRVRRLAALLRLADVCDREHIDRVTSIETRTEPDAVVLCLSCRGGEFPVMDVVPRKAQLFEDEFGLAVKVELRRGTEL
jgi:exopolyphosphatase/guanosine-5'-triphosphate,3'-diphosphate pyrophosphatase